MKYLPKILMILASLVLLLVFLAPIWRISLVAPQYPDGVTMYIWINKISGDSPGTLQNINILNHYVGMKPIEPDSIPELKYFQWIIAAMALLGVVTGFSGNRKLFLAWVALLIILAAAGIYDFYLWEYDYGHDLSPTAPIKVPGMAYQPPLFGKKMLLNFEAYSYPYWGSLFLGLAVAIGLVAWYHSYKMKQ